MAEGVVVKAGALGQGTATRSVYQCEGGAAPNGEIYRSPPSLPSQPRPLLCGRVLSGCGRGGVVPVTLLSPLRRLHVPAQPPPLRLVPTVSLFVLGRLCFLKTEQGLWRRPPGWHWRLGA